MDRVAIISDVHGNITALETVMKDIDARGIREIYCLGDSVLKSCHSDLVIDLIRKRCSVVLKGNCDEAICKPDIPKGKFWTRDLIGEERANYIYHLPVSYDFYMSGYLIRLFHSSPFGLDYLFNPMFSNKDTIYSTTELDNGLSLFENTDFIGKTIDDPIPDIVGYGHIHTPNIFRVKNKTIFNPGSVGMPIEMLNNDISDTTNQFSTVSSYVILEGNLNSKKLAPFNITLIRLPYDIEKEVKLLEASNLPSKERLIKELRSATNCH